MGGKTKQSQRTKNNVRPSSSGRSAEILSNTINVDTSFVKVGSGKVVPAIFPTLTTPTVDHNLSSEYTICFKKLNKKDPITKTKALQELTELIKNGNVEEVVAALPSWAHYYQILIFDPDRRVRETLQTCHGAVMAACGRRSAPQLRRLLPAWLLARCDEHAPAASLAHAHLAATFPDSKLQEALSFCKNEIITLLIDNLTGNPEDMLINKYLDSEERVQATIRIQSASLRTLEHFVATLPETHVNWLWEAIAPLLQANAFWKMAAHNSHNVRAAWYGAAARLARALAARLPRDVSARLLKALLALPERRPGVAAGRWAAALELMHSDKDWYTLLDKKDLLVKRLLDVLENGGWGEARLFSNILLPLLDKLPEEILNKEFFVTFFNAMFTGLENKNTLNSKSERQIWITSLSECLRYLSIQTYDYVAEIVTYVHRTWLEKVFSIKEDQTRTNLIKHSATNMADITKYWLKQASAPNTPNTSNTPQSDKYDQLIRNFWQNIGSTISTQIEKLPLEPNDIAKLIDDHILLLKTLKSTFNQEKKQLSIQFADEATVKVENKSPERITYDKALMDRFRHNLDNLVETTSCQYFDFAYNKSMSTAVFSSLITLLVEFDSEKLFLSISKHHNANSAYEFYDRVLRGWLSGDTMRCKALVEILFLMVKYFSEEEQDAMYNSFQQFPPALVEWCLQRALWAAAGAGAGAGARAARWLRGAAAGACAAALCARDDAGARALLLACLAHGRDGEVMINEAAVTKIIAALCARLAPPAPAAEGGAAEGGAAEGGAALAAQVCAALASTALQAAATPLLLRLFQLNLNVMRGSWSAAAWAEARSAWRDAAAAAAAAFADRALGMLHEYVYRDNDTLDLQRIEHASTLCPYLLISSEANTNKNVNEVVALTKQLFKMEPKPKVPLEIFALRSDCIFGHLNCPFEDDNEFIQKVVSDADKEDEELEKEDLMVFVNKSVFRAFFLRAMLSQNECLDEEDGVTEAWREGLLQDPCYKELFNSMLYDFVVLNSLYERYAFWPHYEIIRDSKERIEKLIEDILLEISLDTKNMLLSHLSEAAAVHGYYWAFARSFLDFKINEKTQKEVEKLAQTPESPRIDDQIKSPVKVNESVESPKDSDEKVALACQNENNEIEDAPNVEENKNDVIDNSAEKECGMGSIDMSKLEEIVTGNGYFHSLQAQSKWSSAAPLSSLRALALRGVCAGGGAAARALQAELRAGAGALDALVNVYYAHNDVMLYEREVVSAPWAQAAHNACVARWLRGEVRARGWALPAHHWDFATITLCSLAASLRDSARGAGCAKVAMLSQAVLELFEAVRTFVSEIPQRAQREQPAEHVAALPGEWKDIFAPDLNVNLLEFITAVLDDHSAPMTLSRSAVADALVRAAPLLQWERVPAARVAPLAGRAADAAARALRAAAHPALLYLADAALCAGDRALVLDDAEKLSLWGGNAEEAAPILSLERLHEPLFALHDLLDAALQDVEVCVRTCETVAASDAARVALAGLLCGAALLRRARHARRDLHHYYVQIAREHEYASHILPHALRLLPAAALQQHALPPAVLALFEAPPPLRVYEWCSHGVVGALACSAVTAALGGVAGAGARAYAAALDARASAALRRLVRAAVAPLLLRRQLAELRDRAAELPDTQVSIQWSRAEVQLSLSVEEQTLSLCIQFSDEHPLTPPRVSSPHALTHGPGQAQGQDTQWIVMYLAYQNGSLLNAAKMWATALASRVAAAPVCYICYCRLLPRARLPAAPCHTCRNEFHAQCLRKWFATSNKSNCPICRSKF